MFYNLQRSTRAAREENEKRKFSKTLNSKERLLNFQKRLKLKELLITKFMQKYNIRERDPMLEDEIN